MLLEHFDALDYMFDAFEHSDAFEALSVCFWFPYIEKQLKCLLFKSW